MKGVNPEWAKLPKRKCDYCGLLYKPKQPLREGMLGFCCSNHRKEFHKHGGAYAKLRLAMEKMIRRELKPLVLKSIREELNWIICNLPEGAALTDWQRAILDPSRPSSPSPRA